MLQNCLNKHPCLNRPNVSLNTTVDSTPPEPPRAPVGVNISNFYKLGEILGEGSYGKVYLGLRLRDQRKFALKMQRPADDEGVPSLTTRELGVLKLFTALGPHPNIIELVDFHLDINFCIWFVFPLCQMSLRGLCKKLWGLDSEEMSQGPPVVYGMTPLLRKHLAFQLVNGVKALHELRVIHRDIKPHNILVDLPKGLLKICDFGLARCENTITEMSTHEVVTLWYRAPEVILHSKKYDLGIDIWSMAVTIVELNMTNNKVLLAGDCEIDQLFRIFNMFGTPSDESWPGAKYGYRNFSKNFPKWPTRDPFEVLESVTMSDTPGDLLRILAHCFVLNPERRANVISIFDSQFFDDLRFLDLNGPDYQLPDLEFLREEKSQKSEGTKIDEESPIEEILSVNCIYD